MMISSDVIAYLQQNFPRHAIDLGESIQLLVATIDETMDSISDKASTVAKGRNRDLVEARLHYGQMEKMEPLVRQLLELLDLLELDKAEGMVDVDLGRSAKEPRNYADYVVDQNIVYSIYEDYTHKRPYAFELGTFRREVRDWKEMFLATCEYLIGVNEGLFRSFAENPDMQGRKVHYFAKSVHPTMRGPRHLESINMYVETVFSANSIRNIIVNMLRKYKIPLSDFHVYLRADYSNMPR